MIAHGLCYCGACADVARRLASDAGDVAALARMTEPERRANGEAPFDDGPAHVSSARSITNSVVSGEWGVPVLSYACQLIAALLRALVLQELVDRIVAWCESTVSP